MSCQAVWKAYLRCDLVSQGPSDFMVQAQNEDQGAHEVWGSSLMVGQEALTDSQQAYSGSLHNGIGGPGNVRAHDGGQVRMELGPDEGDAVSIAQRQGDHQLQADLQDQESDCCPEGHWTCIVPHHVDREPQ